MAAGLRWVDCSYLSFVEPRLIGNLDVFEFRNHLHTLTLPGGHAFYYDQQDVHSLRVMSRTAFGFNVEIAGSFSSSFAGIRAQPIAHTNRTTMFLAQLHRELLRQDSDTMLAVQGIVLQMAAELRRKQRPASIQSPSWLQFATQYLADNLPATIDMEKLTAVAGVGKPEIVRAFRQFFHCTPARYLRDRRIETAKQMLTNSEKPIVEVATEAGFYDQAHFCHQCRRASGYSPREFRELLGFKSFHMKNRGAWWRSNAVPCAVTSRTPDRLREFGLRALHPPLFKRSSA